LLLYTLKGIPVIYTAHTPKQLGQVLKGQRRSQQLTQKQAAQLVGLLPKTISKLELATETATIESLFKLLSALELELAVRSKSDQSRNREW
jgi:HTH-type transcriptional regulator/antitoxin HipB